MSHIAAQNPDEIFDVVDAQDRVIGQATRSEVHARGWWHRAVHILVLNRKVEVLLQKRSRFKDTSPGKWTSSCAGHVDAGESYLAAAVRELAEELGITVASDDLTLCGRLSPTEQTGWEWVNLYCLSHEGPFTVPPAEVEELNWTSFQTLDASLVEQPQAFATSFFSVWKQFREFQLTADFQQDNPDEKHFSETPHEQPR